VLNKAVETKAILITEDKDFGELVYRLKKTNSGILLLRLASVPINEKIEKLFTIIEKYQQELSNSFVVITAKKVRIRRQ